MSKILLVDDSTFTRNTIKRALGETYTYCEASDGASGLKVFAQEKPDLVILDLTMPDMNGLEVLEKLKQLDPRARVVINSADIQEYNKQKAVLLGALGFLNKPVQKDMICEMISQILGPK